MVLKPKRNLRNIDAFISKIIICTPKCRLYNQVKNIKNIGESILIP